MATMKVMRRIFDVLGRDRQLAAANMVRSCPDDWKQGDGAALACLTHRSNTIKTTFAAHLSWAGSLSMQLCGWFWRRQYWNNWLPTTVSRWANFI
jgi:hypothetical protein